MKFKVYEVKRVRDDGKDDYIDSFLYADYKDAVVKFKQFIEEEKKIDWIEEGLASDDKRYTVIESVDYWGFYAEDLWNTLRSEVSIEEREVL